jgi:hypothetical protein
MTSRRGTALGAAAALVCLGAGAASASECELARVDRARTTSQRCMTCHDGSVGSPIFYATRPGGGAPLPGHPVGIEYAPYPARLPALYAPASRLPPEVALVNGRVECTTCHDARAQTPDHVVLTNGLCTACHTL